MSEQMIHGIALSLLAAVAALLGGWVGGTVIRDERGIFGYAMGLLALLAGITWTIGV